MKVIIWGYPLYSHTHSYIHDAFYKAFKYLGYETYWFHDQDYPSDFDWNDCVFWTEGFADKNIPLNENSVYFVHVCPDPAKYINAGIKKFIDVRPNGVWQKDHVYDFTLDKSKTQKIGPCVYYIPKENKKVEVNNKYHSYTIDSYDRLHISWAANALPDKFNLDDVYYPRLNKIWYSGTISNAGVCENYSNFAPFIEECFRNNIEFIYNDPWQNPLTDEQVKKRTMDSVLGVDIRGPELLRNGYIPCRVFKSISWGHLGITNSEETYKELEGNVLYQPDTRQLFYDAMEKRLDYDFIRQSMLYIQENHTYVNRVNNIMSLL
jgi:hypothetical protein